MTRNRLLVVGQFLLDALAGKLGAPMMVLGYATFAVLLLAYVSTQVYTSSLMEDVAARKRDEVLVRERIGVLTARYATMTSKSRVSRHCEEDLGLIGATQDDVVRVAVEGRAPGDVAPSAERVAGALHDLESTLDGNETVRELLVRRRGGGRLWAPGPAVPTKIRFDLGAARASTVVDVFTRDRVGLLHDIAQAFHDAGASIVLARVATEGNRAADGFYLQDERGLSYLFISHDLKVVRALCHRVMVMQHGKIVEQGPVADVLTNPQTEYTARLVRAAFEFARGAGARVRPACSYAALWVQRHKQYADLLV